MNFLGAIIFFTVIPLGFMVSSIIVVLANPLGFLVILSSILFFEYRIAKSIVRDSVVILAVRSRRKLAGKYHLAKYTVVLGAVKSGRQYSQELSVMARTGLDIALQMAHRVPGKGCLVPTFSQQPPVVLLETNQGRHHLQAQKSIG